MSRTAAAPKVNPTWSLMRCIFAFEICLIHVCSLAWYHPQDGWMAETLFISLTRTGTVGFMMLAGALLIGRGPGDVGSYLAHRLRRWLPAILAAQVIYLGFGLWAGIEALEDLTWFDAIEPAWYHIWFFYALATIYMVVVPMRRYDAWASSLPPGAMQAALWGPVALLMVALTAVTLASGGFWGDLRPVNLLVYFGYAWTGHVLARCFPSGTPGGWWLLVGGVGAAALVTTWASDAAGHPVPYYFHRCTIFIAVGAIGQFLVLLQARGAAWRHSTTEWVNRLARLTLGIFLVHPLVIAVAGWPHGWALVASVEWVSMPFAAAILFTLSGAITWLALAILAAMRGGARISLAHRRE